MNPKSSYMIWSIYLIPYTAFLENFSVLFAYLHFSIEPLNEIFYRPYVAPTLFSAVLVFCLVFVFPQCEGKIEQIYEWTARFKIVPDYFFTTSALNITMHLITTVTELLQKQKFDDRILQMAVLSFLWHIKPTDRLSSAGVCSLTWCLHSCSAHVFEWKWMKHLIYCNSPLFRGHDISYTPWHGTDTDTGLLLSLTN